MGRLLAIWSFVIGVILLLFYGLVSILLGLLGMAAGADVVQMLLGIIITLVMGGIGLIVSAIAMFIFGFLAAIVYNIVLGVGGGIDVDFRERS